jgi:hypothetical protein
MTLNVSSVVEGVANAAEHARNEGRIQSESASAQVCPDCGADCGPIRIPRIMRNQNDPETLQILRTGSCASLTPVIGGPAADAAD